MQGSRIAGRLWVGNSADAKDWLENPAAGKCAVINVARDLDLPAQHGNPNVYLYRQAGLVDGPGNSVKDAAAAIIAVDEAMELGEGPVLLCCHGGASRSPAVAGAWLAYHCGAPNPMGLVMARRVEACPRYQVVSICAEALRKLVEGRNA